MPHAATRAPAAASPHRASSGLGERCQTHDLWHELGRQIALFLQGVTLADVVNGKVAGRAVPLAAETPPLAAE